MGVVVETYRQGAVFNAVLSRPEKRNALSAELLDELEAAVHAANDDRDASVIVIRARGPVFSAGYDLSRYDGLSHAEVDPWSDRERLRRQNHTHETIWNSPLPVVAALQGPALAGGADLALHCDFLLLAESASVAYPPVRDLGAPPTNLWLYRLGPMRAKQALLTGDRIDARTAVEWGLATGLFPDAEFEQAVDDFAERLARTSRELLISNKWVVNRGVDLMGRAVLNRIAETEDALGHMSPAAHGFREAARARGLRTAISERDARYAT